MFVKICGLTSAEAVAAAVDAGADGLGFVFAPSPREITPERAAALCRDVPSRIKRVAVLRHPPDALWRRVARDFAPDWLQTDAADFDAIELPPGCAPLPVYRASVARDAELPPRLLFEGEASGSGVRADWDEAARLAGDTQLILAGGLDERNVGAAIERVRPWGVDVSSGVEGSRGRKDPAKIQAFVARVRALTE